MEPIFERFMKKHKLYNSREIFGQWIAKQYGKEYVDDALNKYDILCNGGTIDGYIQTALFIDMIAKSKGI